MPLNEAFATAAGSPEAERKKTKRKRPAPFTIRLSAADRARLEREAGGAPLGTFIKARLLETKLPARMRRAGLRIEDRAALGKALALLGQSRLASNLNQLARAVHIGALPVTPDTEAELRAALSDIHALRRLVMTALGLQPAEVAP